MKSKFTFAN